VYSNNILFIPIGHDTECVSDDDYSATSVLTATPFLPYNTPLVLGTSFPPVRSMAWRMARARALKADSALWTAMSDLMHLTSPERISIPVVVVLATQDVYMQRASGCHGKRIKYVREHLC
jgi:hypothetical protein